MTTAIIDRIHAAEGEMIPLGGKFLDLTVDLSAAFPHDCPPIEHYRLVLRDRAWLRRLDVASRDVPKVGARLALLSTDPSEPLDGKPAREVRFSTVAILTQNLWGAV